MFIWVSIGLIVIIVLLVIKIILMQKSMDEIIENMDECLSKDTNVLISISSNDSHVKKLANNLNQQLQQLRQLRWKLAQGNMELKNAITNISHDLRTPLTSICGYLDLLDEIEKDEIIDRYLDIIKERTDVLKQMTEELFKYSVIVTPQNELKQEYKIINSILEECIAAHYASLVQRNIIPKIKITEKKIERYVDASALLRVFENVIDNAVKYSDGDLEIILDEKGLITFANTAANLSEVQVNRLFDRFFTVEDARKSTGLGLAISKTLIEQMNGTIHAQLVDHKLQIYVDLH